MKTIVSARVCVHLYVYCAVGRKSSCGYPLLPVMLMLPLREKTGPTNLSRAIKFSIHCHYHHSPPRLAMRRIRPSVYDSMYT